MTPLNERHPPARACRAAAFLACVVTSVCSSAAATPAIEVSDDLQRVVTLDKPAARIVSLAPHLTELVYSAGAGDRLVGVSRHCDYPPPVAQLTRVSDHTTFNYELISELRPDLVLVWKAGLKDTALRRLVSLYRNVYVSGPADFKDVAENVVEIGALTGDAAQARHAADTFLRAIDELGARHARKRPVRTLYLVWHDPPMTVGGDHWISRAIGLCGGVNVFADVFTDVVRINRESLRLVKADVILHSLGDALSPDHLAALTGSSGAADDTPVFHVEGDSLQRPSLRLAHSAARLCRLIH